MKKSDLKNRMVLKCRNGEKYIVIDDMLFSTEGYNNLSDYNEDLTFTRTTEDLEKICAIFDIIEVYDKVYSINFDENELKLLWLREEES